MAPATDDVVTRLDALRQEVEGCAACPLGATRTKVVFGDGDYGADLMFVGEAPGYHEDQQGRPFVGQAGKLLDELLASIGMGREQVFIGNVLKCRPPNNRDPRPEEIDACRPNLWRQIEIIKPKVICTLGNFSTKLLSGDQTGITKVHGRPRETVIAGHSLYLYPIFHPAAALYTPAMRTTLQEDFSRLPELLAHAAPESAGEPAAERPAWRPPEHLRRQTSAAASPAEGSAEAAPTLEDVVADAPPTVASTVRSDSADRPDTPPGAAAEHTSPASDSKPVEPPAPPGKPEQLGLF